MVLELVDIVSEPFGLQDWSLRVAFFVLFAGLFITLIISWIFDVTPEGVEKTKPSSELQEGEKTVVLNSWRIATYVSFVVIAGLVVLNIFNLNKVSESLTQYGKSIAVLPFINDTQDKKNDQFINGTMESILNNLSRIKDLRVVSRTSVEQYRDSIISIHEVAKKQQVSYVLEGSMQKYGYQIRITLKLIDQHNRHLWSKQYDREIKKAGDYFDTGFEYIDKMIELDRQFSFLYLGAIYAFLGNKEKAYENLRLHDRRQTNSFFYIAEIKNDPMFDNIRDESECQQIVHSMETKYQAEHERVRKWLEENNML